MRAANSFRHEAVPRWSIQFLRENFLCQSSHAGDQKKLFLDRVLAQRRPIVNQAEVREHLSGRGYAIVDPPRLSFQEQVSLFRGAGSIVSSHGAGLANLCFVEAGTSLLEIFSQLSTRWII
jgi:capsular polysaccharide biosynthesis protein